MEQNDRTYPKTCDLLQLIIEETASEKKARSIRDTDRKDVDTDSFRKIKD